jgi:hypothetical protein
MRRVFALSGIYRAGAQYLRKPLGKLRIVLKHPQDGLHILVR